MCKMCYLQRHMRLSDSVDTRIKSFPVSGWLKILYKRLSMSSAIVDKVNRSRLNGFRTIRHTHSLTHFVPLLFHISARIIPRLIHAYSSDAVEFNNIMSVKNSIMLSNIFTIIYSCIHCSMHNLQQLYHKSNNKDRLQDYCELFRLRINFVPW